MRNTIRQRWKKQSRRSKIALVASNTVPEMRRGGTPPLLPEMVLRFNLDAFGIF